MIKIKIPIYDQVVYLATNSIEAAKKAGIEIDTGDLVTVEMKSSVLIYVGDNPDLSLTSTLTSLVHESTHAAMCLLENVGVTYSYEHQETLCYLIDYIFTQSITRLSKFTASLPNPPKEP